MQHFLLTVIVSIYKETIQYTFIIYNVIYHIFIHNAEHKIFLFHKRLMNIFFEISPLQSIGGNL